VALEGGAQFRVGIAGAAVVDQRGRIWVHGGAPLDHMDPALHGFVPFVAKASLQKVLL
jgi:hypothetical protein